MHWLAGSLYFTLMKHVSVCLAGRMGLLHREGLSQAEHDCQSDRPPFLPADASRSTDPGALKQSEPGPCLHTVTTPVTVLFRIRERMQAAFLVWPGLCLYDCAAQQTCCWTLCSGERNTNEIGDKQPKHYALRLSKKLCEATRRCRPRRTSWLRLTGRRFAWTHLRLGRAAA